MNHARVIRRCGPTLGLEGLLQRRNLLRVGALSVAASALPAAFARSGASVHAAAKSEVREGQGKARSVNFLWMGGGVTHIDSFDPKPDAPVEVQGRSTSSRCLERSCENGANCAHRSRMRRNASW